MEGNSPFLSARRKICREERLVGSALGQRSRRPPAAPDLGQIAHSSPGAWELSPYFLPSRGGDPIGWDPEQGRDVAGRGPPSRPSGSSRPLSLLCRQPAHSHAHRHMHTRVDSLAHTVHMLGGALTQPSVHMPSPTVAGLAAHSEFVSHAHSHRPYIFTALSGRLG